MKRTIFWLLVALITACATPEGMRPVKSKDKVVYRLPAEGLEQGEISGISFDFKAYECVRSGFKYLRDTKMIQQGDDRCAINFMTFIVGASQGARHSPQIAYDSYLFDIDKSSSEGITTLEFKPRYEAVHPYRNFGNSSISPPHSIESALEVLATSGVLTFQFEVDSPLRPSAVAANFRKYFKMRSHAQQPVTVMRKSFTTSYLLLTGGNPLATFYLTLKPRQQGSAVSVIARLRLAPDDNYRVDAVGQARDVRKLVADAVDATPAQAAKRR